MTMASLRSRLHAAAAAAAALRLPRITTVRAHGYRLETGGAGDDHGGT
ncbi:hypothetical protein [Streptomyces sp. NPDC051286]